MEMKSKVDCWIALLLGGSVLACAAAALSLFAAGGVTAWVLAVLVLLGGVGLPASLLVNTRYRLEGDHLLAVSGPFRWRVQYRDIRSVEQSRTLLSGPALSMDRLLVDYGPMRWLVISPDDPEAFRAALIQRVGAATTGRAAET